MVPMEPRKRLAWIVAGGQGLARVPREKWILSSHCARNRKAEMISRYNGAHYIEQQQKKNKAFRDSSKVRRKLYRKSVVRI